MFHVLVGTNDSDIEAIRAAAVSKRRRLRWVIPKQALIGDEVVLFTHAEGFLAKARVASRPLPSHFGNRNVYRGNLDKLTLLRSPVLLKQVAERIPAWGWVRQRMKSYTTPSDETAEQLLALINRYRKVPKTRPKSSFSKHGAGFGNPEVNAEVEAAAIGTARRHYEAAGWNVVSVEQKKCGYDLRCTRITEFLCVEVKGVSGRLPAFILTTGELREAKSNPKFVLCIVTRARSKNPKVEIVPGRSLKTRYSLEPLAYKARPR